MQRFIALQLPISIYSFLIVLLSIYPLFALIGFAMEYIAYILLTFFNQTIFGYPNPEIIKGNVVFVGVNLLLLAPFLYQVIRYFWLFKVIKKISRN